MISALCSSAFLFRSRSLLLKSILAASSGTGHRQAAETALAIGKEEKEKRKKRGKKRKTRERKEEKRRERSHRKDKEKRRKEKY